VKAFLYDLPLFAGYLERYDQIDNGPTFDAVDQFLADVRGGSLPIDT